MEPLRNTSQLLRRLSHANYILVYLGTYNKVRNIMVRLCKSTKNFWATNKIELMNIFANCRVKLKYIKPFNQNLANYLLDNDRYFDYELDVYLDNDFSVQSFLKFINQVDISHQRDSNPEYCCHENNTKGALEEDNGTQFQGEQTLPSRYSKHPVMLKFTNIKIEKYRYEDALTAHVINRALTGIGVGSEGVEFDTRKFLGINIGGLGMRPKEISYFSRKPQQIIPWGMYTYKSI